MTRGRRFKRRYAAITGLAVAVVACGAGAPPAADEIEVDASPVRQFDKRSDRVRFGELTYVGGIEFSASGAALGGISAFRFTADGNRFLAVTDSGSWFAGRLHRDAQGAPDAIADAVVSPLLAPDGTPMSGKIEADAESLTIEAGRAVVGFEREHRVYAYDNAAAPFDSKAMPLALPLPRHELRTNRGIETLATAPAGTALAGRMVAVAERSIDTEGNLFAALWGDGPSEIFKVRKDKDWDVSDGTFLPGGDLVLLERRYTGILGGLGIRVRRIAAATIVAGALVDGPVIAAFDLGQEIDNMEGIDAWVDPSGATRLTMVSDDNNSFFQRNLILEFRLADEPASTN